VLIGVGGKETYFVLNPHTDIYQIIQHFQMHAQWCCHACLSAWNDTAPTGWILVELFINDINLEAFEGTEFNEMSSSSGCAGGLVAPKLSCKGKGKCKANPLQALRVPGG
jgi:hypothetical protein